MKRALGRLDGVRHVEAVPGTLRVKILPVDDRTLDLAAIAPRLWEEGIRVTAMTIVAEGAVEGGSGGRTFRIRGWPDAWPLDGEAESGLLRADVTFADGAPRLRVG